MKENDKHRHLAQEKQKARDLRNSQWWKNRLAEGKCHYCGGSFHPSELTMEHIVPISRGGKSVRGNITTSCKACNSSKKNLLPVELVLMELYKE